MRKLNPAPKTTVVAEDKRFASRFASMRRRKGLMQKEIALKLGISNQAVSKWECGLGTPKIATLIALSSLLEVSLDELVGKQKIKIQI